MISPTIRHEALVLAVTSLLEAKCKHPVADSLREEKRAELVCSECGAPFRLRTGRAT